MSSFYSMFLNIHQSGVLTALAWLVPHETAAVLAHSVSTIQPCLYPSYLCTPHSSLPSDIGFTPYSPPPYLYPPDLCIPYSSLPSLTLASLCPTYMLISSGPFTLQNSKMNPLKKKYILNRKLFPCTLCTNSSKKWQKHITHLLHSIDLLRYSQIHYHLQSVYRCLQKDQSRKEYLRKLREHSVATAFASRVFPVPGGPYSKTPVTHTHTHPYIKMDHWFLKLSTKQFTAGRSSTSNETQPLAFTLLSHCLNARSIEYANFPFWYFSWFLPDLLHKKTKTVQIFWKVWKVTTIFFMLKNILVFKLLIFVVLCSVLKKQKHSRMMVVSVLCIISARILWNGCFSPLPCISALWWWWLEVMVMMTKL